MGNKEGLEELISNNCPEDEVIAFIIGKDSPRLPTAEDMKKLLDHIFGENNKRFVVNNGFKGGLFSRKQSKDIIIDIFSRKDVDREGNPGFNVVQNDIISPKLEDMISILENQKNAFTRQNLWILWHLAHNNKMKEIMIHALAGGILAVVITATFFLLKSTSDDGKIVKVIKCGKIVEDINFRKLFLSHDGNDSCEEDDITPLNEKNSGDDFTQEEWDKINEYEFGQEWLDREDELRDMSLEDYDEMRRVSEYGLDDWELEILMTRD